MIKAAGILFCTPDRKILLLKRSGEGDHAREWALAGGGIEEGETPEQAALRELSEECGMKYEGELSPIFHTDDGNVDYTTFVAHVEEFTPKLNDEHTAFMWCDADDIPNKTHPGVKALLDSEEVKSALGDGEIYADATFKESDHPRAEDGKFGSGGAGAPSNDLKNKVDKLVNKEIGGITYFRPPETKRQKKEFINSLGLDTEEEKEQARSYLQGIIHKKSSEDEIKRQERIRQGEEIERKKAEYANSAEGRAEKAISEKKQYGAASDFLSDEQKKEIQFYEGDRFSVNAEGKNQVVNSIQKEAEKRGLKIEKVSESQEGKSKSLYIRSGDKLIRVSDHELPLTAAREHNRAQGLTGVWDKEVIISDWKNTPIEDYFKEIESTHKNDSEVRADSAEVVTEMDIAKRIRDKELTSPQEYKNIMIFALRISGTGVAYRSKLNEYVDRPKEEYLCDEFLERCNGLPVIWVHPPKDKLDTESFAEKVIGTICLPYIEGDEVWGIAKIYDMDAAAEMAKTQLSTSPSVIFDDGTNTKIMLANGEHILQEGKPSLIDHLAVVPNGVWDKGGEPSGVLLETAHAEIAEASRADSAGQCDYLVKEETMAEETTAAAPAAAPSAESEMLTLLKGVASKLEGMEGRLAKLEGMEVKEAAEIAKPDAVATMMKPVPETAADNMAAGATAATEPDPAVVADRARLDAVEKELEQFRADAARADNQEERGKLLEAQAKADSVEQCYGDSARAPLRGETVNEYELATVKKHQARSKRWSGVDLASIKDESAFAIIRDEVYADSIKAAHSCTGLADDVIVPIKTVDGGCTTTVFRGKQSFIKSMSQKPM